MHTQSVAKETAAFHLHIRYPGIDIVNRTAASPFAVGAVSITVRESGICYTSLATPASMHRYSTNNNSSKILHKRSPEAL